MPVKPPEQLALVRLAFFEGLSQSAIARSARSRAESLSRSGSGLEAMRRSWAAQAFRHELMKVLRSSPFLSAAF